jgi:hypothetical protein
MKKPLELINSIKLKDFKSTYKNIICNNEFGEKEIMTANSVHNSFKNKIKYLTVNLTKEVKDLYDENYKMLMKEIEGIKKWKDALC